MMSAYREVMEVGRANGVALPDDAVEIIAGYSDSLPAHQKPSMALDLERGNRLELPWLGGKVVELGKKLGVPTPTHSLMYAMLKPLHHGEACVMPLIENATIRKLRAGGLALGFGVHHLRTAAAGMIAAATGHDWLFIDTRARCVFAG